MAGAQHKRGRPRKPKGWTKRTIAIDDVIFQAAKELAVRQRSSLRALVEQGLLTQLHQETAQRTDAELAPLIDRVVRDQHKRLDSGLRTMMARVAFEVLRTQYVWLNFLTEAGFEPSKVESWREQGWNYAIKEFKRQNRPRLDEEPDD